MDNGGCVSAHRANNKTLQGKSSDRVEKRHNFVLLLQMDKWICAAAVLLCREFNYFSVDL